jgi:hypothetical protein
MLYTIAVVLLILWVLGLVTSYTMGGLLHILLVVAVIWSSSISSAVVAIIMVQPNQKENG